MKMTMADIARSGAGPSWKIFSTSEQSSGAGLKRPLLSSVFRIFMKYGNTDHESPFRPRAPAPARHPAAADAAFSRPAVRGRHLPRARTEGEHAVELPVAPHAGGARHAGAVGYVASLRSRHGRPTRHGRLPLQRLLSRPAGPVLAHCARRQTRSRPHVPRSVSRAVHLHR